MDEEEITHRSLTDFGDLKVGTTATMKRERQMVLLVFPSFALGALLLSPEFHLVTP